MITDDLTTAIKGLLEGSSDVAYPRLATCSVYDRDSTDVRDYPAITIQDNGFDEDDLLTGVYMVDMSITLATIPNDTSTDGTIMAEHRAIASEIVSIIQCEQTAANNETGYLFNSQGIKLFDIREIGMANRRDDGRNITEITMTLVCCSNQQIYSPIN